MSQYSGSQHSSGHWDDIVGSSAHSRQGAINKTIETAEGVAVASGINPQVARALTFKIYKEARRSMLAMLGPHGEESWESLSFKDRAAIASEVVRGLLDKRRLAEFIEGDRRSIA
jgi:hypothetical protein